MIMDPLLLHLILQHLDMVPRVKGQNPLHRDMNLLLFHPIPQQLLTVLPVKDQILHHMDMDRLLLPLDTITNNAGHYFQKSLFITL